MVSQRFAILLILYTFSSVALSQSFPINDNVIGDLKTVQLHTGDTLYGMLKKEDMGYDEIIAANPALHTHDAEAGMALIIPSKHLIPDHPQKGIVINLSEKRLYYFTKQKVYTYPVSIGRSGWETPLGQLKIIQKQVDPTWFVPESIREAEQALGNTLPKRIPSGPNNPLGSRAMRLSKPSYLIHGTNTPKTIGTRGTAGCIRMYEKDVQELYSMVPLNTPVHIINHPIKWKIIHSELWVESVPNLVERTDLVPKRYWQSEQESLKAIEGLPLHPKDKNYLHQIIEAHLGFPILIGRIYETPQT